MLWPPCHALRYYAAWLAWMTWRAAAGVCTVPRYVCMYVCMYLWVYNRREKKEKGNKDVEPLVRSNPTHILTDSSPVEGE